MMTRQYRWTLLQAVFLEIGSLLEKSEEVFPSEMSLKPMFLQDRQYRSIISAIAPVSDFLVFKNFCLAGVLKNRSLTSYGCAAWP